MENLYYQAPSKEIFIEVQKEAIKIWERCNPPYGTEKAHTVRTLDNIADNVMYIVWMFDTGNQKLLSVSLSEEARTAISERLASGGLPNNLNNFKINL